MAEKKIEIYYSEWLALIPLLLFVVGAMYLGLSGSPDEKGSWPIISVCLIIALLLSKDKEIFSNIVIQGMSEKLVMIMITAWLFSSTIGVFLRETGLVDTIVNLYLSTGLGGGFFVVGVFIISAFVGTSTGTAVGTVLIVGPVLFKAGNSLGCDSYFLIGAILSGAAFGDDFSPLSDTTIASATTQEVNIGNSVKSRLKYALAAAIPSLFIFLIFGGNNSNTNYQHNTAINYYSLFMLLSPLVVIYLCLKGKNILSSLLLGIFTALLVSVVFQLLPLSKIFSLDPLNFSATSIFIDGMEKGIGISIFSILLIGLVSFILSTSIVTIIIEKISSLIKIKSFAELLIVFFTVAVNTLLAHNTITIMSIGSFVKNISDRFNINRIRAANLLDISGNTVMHIFPYMITVVLAASIANQEIGDGQTLNPFIAGLHNVHSLLLFLIAVIVSSTGFWRKSDEKFM